MNRLTLAALICLSGLLPAPTAAQLITPQWSLAKTGTCRAISLHDVPSFAQIPIGCIGNDEGFHINGVAPFNTPAGSTPTNLQEFNVGGYPASAEIPAATVQGLVSKVNVPTSFTGAPWPVNGISSYVLSGNSVSGNSHASFFGFAGSTANGANPYNLNTVWSNCPRIVTTPGSNSCYNFNIGFGIELDFNVMKTSTGAAPTGGLTGLSILGGSETGTTGHTSAVEVASLDTFGLYPWMSVFHARAGSGNTGLQLDPTAWSGTGLYSMPIILYSGSITNGNTDSPPAGLYGSIIRGNPNGDLEFTAHSNNFIFNGLSTIQSYIYSAHAISVGTGGIQMQEVPAASLGNAAAGTQILFIDSTTHKLERKDSTGAVTVIG